MESFGLQLKLARRSFRFDARIHAKNLLLCFAAEIRWRNISLGSSNALTKFRPRNLLICSPSSFMEISLRSSTSFAVGSLNVLTESFGLQLKFVQGIFCFAAASFYWERHMNNYIIHYRCIDANMDKRPNDLLRSIRLRRRCRYAQNGFTDVFAKLNTDSS